MSAPPPIRGVTFDVDGTLYLAKPMRRRFALANWRKLRTIRVATAVRQELRGRSFADGDAYFAEETRLIAERLERDPKAVRDEVDTLLGPRLCDTLRKVGPVPDATAHLQRLLDAGLQIAAVSDYAVEDKLDALGLSALPWRAKIACDALGALKPDPRGFLLAAEQLDVEPAHLVHVGDREDTDAVGARAAGMRAVTIGSDVPDFAAAIEHVLALRA